MAFILVVLEFHKYKNHSKTQLF